MRTQRIGVLSGGESPEREVSRQSGRNVHAALQRRGHDAALIDLGHLDGLVESIAEVDTVFNCLHGGAGENGTVQLLLDLLRIPYTGSGARSAFLAMDKLRSRARFAAAGLAVAPGLEWHGQDLDRFGEAVLGEIGLPAVVKPVDAGSSVGVTIVNHRDELHSALRQVVDGFGAGIVEAHIPGRELTVGILERDGVDAPLPIIEIRSRRRFFDYDAKYVAGQAEFLVPAPLEDAITSRVQDVALRAHHALGCSGYSRVDLRLHEDGTPFVLEVNALPGMTPASDLPRAAEAAGLGFDALVETMLATAGKESG
jgi:D-alanine-D-alanine ligase